MIGLAFKPICLMELTVREFKPQDLLKVANLCAQLGYPTAHDELESRLDRITSDPLRGFYVAADEKDICVGWIHVWGLLQVENSGIAQIAGLIVDEAVRGKGYGRALINSAEKWAKDHGYKTLYLHSRLQRDKAHRFYENAGFEILKTSLAFAKTL